MPGNLKTLGYLLIIFSLILIVILAFVKLDYDRQAAFLCGATQDLGADMLQCPVHTSNTSWLLVGAFGLAFLMLGAGIYMAFISKPALLDMKREFRHVDMSRLDGDEKAVYGAIKARGGSAYQTDLIKETGFSKVKVTRVLDRMESKDILERKRRGMANMIVLK